MDFKKQCWYCGKLAMQLKDSFYQCSACGATWNSQPDLESYMGVNKTKEGMGPGTSGRPARKRGKVLTPMDSATAANLRKRRAEGLPIY